VVRLPYRFAPFESHKEETVARVRRLIASRKPPEHWVLAGHSLGAALAARFAKTDYQMLSGLVLIGTTHPKEDDLSFLPIPVTKVYATNDGVAPAERVMANKGLLPGRTTWVAIQRGNHSQFGHYGHQLFDRRAEISRDEQQALTRDALLRALADAR